VVVVAVRLARVLRSLVKDARKLASTNLERIH